MKNPANSSTGSPEPADREQTTSEDPLTQLTKNNLENDFTDDAEEAE